jgi:hypothetical protein
VFCELYCQRQHDVTDMLKNGIGAVPRCIVENREHLKFNLYARYKVNLILSNLTYEPSSFNLYGNRLITTQYNVC